MSNFLLWNTMKMLKNRLGPRKLLFPYAAKQCDQVFQTYIEEIGALVTTLKCSERIFLDYKYLYEIRYLVLGQIKRH